MNTWYLIGFFSLLLILAFIIVLAPFRKMESARAKIKAFVFALIFCLLAILAYAYWGMPIGAIGHPCKLMCKKNKKRKKLRPC
jgi:hypothetical protein